MAAQRLSGVLKVREKRLADWRLLSTAGVQMDELYFYRTMEAITSLHQLDLNKKYSYQEYLTWQFQDVVELIKGRIMKISPAPLLNTRLSWAGFLGIWNNIFDAKSVAYL